MAARARIVVKSTECIMLVDVYLFNYLRKFRTMKEAGKE
jgi:hypothetical protein